MNDRTIIRHQPGIYFGLDESSYHSDDALGSSDVRRLLNCPAEFWWHSAMNPLRPADEDTPSKLYGRALHKLVLEGREAFEASFCAAPSKDDYPDALVTVEQIKAYLDEVTTQRGITHSRASKKEALEAVAREFGAVLWSDITSKFCAGTRTQLKPDVYAEVVSAADQIASNDRLAAAFQNGRAEVSVFWEFGTSPNGIRLKSRLDYLKVRQLINLKSFRRAGSEAPPDRVVGNAIGRYRYDIGAAMHMAAREQANKFIASGTVFGDELPSMDWLDTVASESDYEAWLVFYQAEGAPIVVPRRFRKDNPVLIAAHAEIGTALGVYRDHMAQYGTGPWPYHDPVLDPDVEWNMLPRWMGQGVAA